MTDDSLGGKVGELKSEISSLIYRQQEEINKVIDRWARRHARPPDPKLLSHLTTQDSPSPNTGMSSAETPVELPDSLGKQTEDEVSLPGQAAEHKSVENFAIEPVRCEQESQHETKQRDQETESKLKRASTEALDLKGKVREALHITELQPEDPFHSSGWASTIVRHRFFEYTMQLVTLLDSIWIGYETDYNDATTLAVAEVQYQVVDNIFCVYFVGEWAIRFAAFKSKAYALTKDRWFMFASLLSVFIVIETWIFPAITMQGTTASDIIRLFRLLRLVRVARLLGAVPDLLIVCKAIMVSLKSVIYTFVLLIVIIYLFAIAFTLLLDGKTSAKDSSAYMNFRSVGVSMNTLLLNGALPDQSQLVNDMLDKSFFYYVLMLVYLVIASLTLMNMLIGIMCEVIEDVSGSEKEIILRQRVQADLRSVMDSSGIGGDDGKYISKADFKELLAIPAAAQTLDSVGIDVFSLVDCMDLVFGEESEKVKFESIMELVLKLRGANQATVKDIIGLRQRLQDMSYAVNIMLEKKLGDGPLLKAS
eukprot:TRINITY_DN105982_c0_g1_i1.p1 TRINITY_DN105982_c0_g1~~TRINITY_DN105982_c0_g1_i1.p1  ORF type:complete len:536 (+),score=81.63 TRINITY_DN105982_c0_g1_i1:158-1765(+)